MGVNFTIRNETESLIDLVALAVVLVASRCYFIKEFIELKLLKCGLLNSNLRIFVYAIEKIHKAFVGRL